MKYKLFSISILLFSTFLCHAQKAPTDELKTGKGSLIITPIQHASFIMTWDGKTIYVDPAHKAALYKEHKAPNLILITDIHGDHLNTDVLKSIDKANAIIVAPQAVANLLPASLKKKVVILRNGEQTKQLDISITAIPMYNLPETDTSRHVKGRGNGYVLDIGGKKVYISGDTEDIPEMRKLKDIDLAFVCMNLPYTMDINQAASAVLEFKPGIVYPYHHRGQDINVFKKLVNEGNKKIEVRTRNWYPQ